MNRSRRRAMALLAGAAAGVGVREQPARAETFADRYPPDAIFEDARSMALLLPHGHAAAAMWVRLKGRRSIA